MHGQRPEPDQGNMALSALKDDWAAALETHLRTGKGEPVPPGWLTIPEICKLWSYGRAQAARQLKLMKAAGKCESKKFHVLHYRQGSGAFKSYTRMAEHFRLTSPDRARKP